MTETTSKAERFAGLIEIGCIVCRLFYGVRSEPCIHHLTGIRFRATGKKSAWEHTIPLCPKHHQYGDNTHPSVHGQPKLFREKYASQEELLEKTNIILEKMQ